MATSIAALRRMLDSDVGYSFRKSPVAIVSVDAGRRAVEAEVPDAAPSPDAAIARDASPVDAARLPDAAPSPDAARTGPDAGDDYKSALEKARRSLDDGDYEAALAMADLSLTMRRSARAYIVRADALRRLGRTDPAVAAIDLAIKANPSYPPAWELKGKILWGARRYAEARPAYEQYLKLEPKGETADTVRALLGSK